MAWKKTKKTNYGLKLIRQDLWGKYARKIANRGINKQEYMIKDHDDILHRVHASRIYWFYKQEKHKREGFPFKVREKRKQRIFRTRKLLKFYYENLKFHNIKNTYEESLCKEWHGCAVKFL